MLNGIHYAECYCADCHDADCHKKPFMLSLVVSALTLGNATQIGCAQGGQGPDGGGDRAEWHTFFDYKYCQCKHRLIS
jgi:hypothetical protein